MAGSVALELKAVTSEFIAKMREAGEEVEKLGKKSSSSFDKLASVGKAAFLGIVTSGVAVGGMALHLADDFEKSHARLTAALTAAGTSFDAWKGQIGQTDKAMENLGFTNAQTEDALSHFVVATQDPKKALEQMGLAADIARARNIDLTTATDLVAKAMTGNLRPLKQMGIDLPIVASSAEKLKKAHDALALAQQNLTQITQQYPNAAEAGSKAHAKYEAAVAKVTVAEQNFKDMSAASGEILKALHQRMDGQAKAAAETFAGRVEVLKTKMEDLGKNIGLALIPIIEKLASVVADIIGWLQKHSDVVIALAGVIGGVLVTSIGAWIAELVSSAAESVGAFASWVAGFGAVDAAEATTVAESEAAGPAITAALGPIGIILGAVGVAAFELYKHWDTVWHGIKDIALDVWHFLESYGQWIAGAFFGPIGFAAVELAKHWSDVWNAIRDAALAVWHFLDSNVVQPIEAGLGDVEHFAQHLFNIWTSVWNAIGDALKWVWDHTLGPVLDAIKSALNDTVGLLSKVGGAISKVAGGVGGAAKSVFTLGGLLADGGPASAGVPYIVGENGPELFVPSSSGTVVPNGKFGQASAGGTVVNLHVSGSVLTEGQLITTVRDGLARLNQRSGPAQAAKLMGLA